MANLISEQVGATTIFQQLPDSLPRQPKLLAYILVSLPPLTQGEDVLQTIWVVDPRTPMVRQAKWPHEPLEFWITDAISISHFLPGLPSHDGVAHVQAVGQEGLPRVRL
jgi:hypothetical protein